MQMEDRSRTWAEISLDALEQNYKTIVSRLPGKCRFMGLVKADAYGHGAVRVAEKLQSLGANYLAVATPSEALELRGAGIGLPVLVLGATQPDMICSLADEDITQTVVSAQAAKAYCGALGDRSLRVHIKVDTGMSRLGIVCSGRLEEAAREIQEILLLPNLECEGIYTHLATSDLPYDNNTNEQVRLFNSLVDRVYKTSGFLFQIKHCANSGAYINYPETMGDMCRPGIALYGYPPAGFAGLRPVMTLKTRIAQIKDIAPGAGVSYGRTYIADRKMRLAVLPVGYADGLHRCLSGRFAFTIGSKRAPQIGRICMDMCMADVTDIEAGPGDEAIVFGENAFENASTLAARAGTIPYEILCAVSSRVPRYFR